VRILYPIETGKSVGARKRAGEIEEQRVWDLNVIVAYLKEFKFCCFVTTTHRSVNNIMRTQYYRRIIKESILEIYILFSILRQYLGDNKLYKQNRKVSFTIIEAMYMDLGGIDVQLL